MSFSCNDLFCFSNQAEIARLLLSKGANVNVLNNSMCTALHIAVNKGFTDVVRVLTEHSADVNLQVSGCRVLAPAALTKAMYTRGRFFFFFDEYFPPLP